jgi:hypothetical protein
MFAELFFETIFIGHEKVGREAHLYIDRPPIASTK